MSAQLNIAKRFDLSDLGEGWEDCYITYRPMTVGDLLTIEKMRPESMKSAEQMDFILKHISEHVVGGRVSVLVNDAAQTVDFSREEHLPILPFETLTALFQQMTGVAGDPKAPTITTPTETSSSTV